MQKVSHAEMWLTGTGAYAMPDFVKDQMNLVERLRNPAWEADNDGMPRRLNVDQTVADMAEAAKIIETMGADSK